jgi:hypothetical protein
VCRHLNRRTVLEVLGYLLKSQRERDNESVKQPEEGIR